MLALLHISDLHRTAGPRVRNDELLAAMSSDAERWRLEGIPRPDLIIVSGDLIQGVPADAQGSDDEIEAQYAEAADFLVRLATEFVDSDRSRVVIVPGNHDVDLSRARGAMNPLPDCPTGIAGDALRANSGIRWNWLDQRAYEITDSALYESRYDHFLKFRADFYEGVNPNPLGRGGGDLVFAEYPSLGLVVVGFASWYGNDCFCHIGDIDPAALASSQKLLAGSSAPVAVAVWHHSLLDGPRAQDYMDQRVTHKLIDFGFTVGLHGHQHYPDAAPYELRLPHLTSMVVASAGSLAVGDDQLPAGERRQFNVIAIDPDDASLTVHVRAMSPGGVFSGMPRADFGGNTFIKLNLPPSPERPLVPSATQLLDEAMTAVRLRQFGRALELLPDLPTAIPSRTRRQIAIEALEGLERCDELLELLRVPETPDEATKAISLLLEVERFDDAAALLEAASPLLDPGTFKDLAAVIAARRMLHHAAC